MRLSVSSTGAGTDPGRVLVLVHGIMGSGRNLAGWARRLGARFPGWRFVTVDLRGHGDSHPASPPHDIDACVADLRETMTALGVCPRVAVGHSFGGKVVAAWACRGGPELAVVLDAVPFAVAEGSLDDEVAAVVRAVAELRGPFRSFDEVRDAFLGRGFSDLLAGWMTTNLRRTEGGLEWRFDLSTVLELLQSYLRVDLAAEMASHPGRLTLVRAGRSTRWTAGVLERLRALGPAVAVVHLPDAGHWVHVDAPDAVMQVLVAACEEADRRKDG